MVDPIKVGNENHFAWQSLFMGDRNIHRIGTSFKLLAEEMVASSQVFRLVRGLVTDSSLNEDGLIHTLLASN